MTFTFSRTGGGLTAAQPTSTVLFILLCIAEALLAPTLVQAQALPIAQVEKGRSFVGMPAPGGSKPLDHSASPTTSTSALPGQSPELLIDCGDLLDVSVFDTPELSAKSRVDHDGTITLPVGGRVLVKALNARQAKAAIENQLRQREVLRDPQVSVLVVEYATQGVNVMGEVKAPGIYPLMGRHDVLDLISVAGGLTSFASKMVTINHKDSPDQVVAIDLSAPPKDLAGADVTIQPGDRIVVMRAGIVYVIGDVGRPGGYLMGPHDALTALQALSLAQGINKTAKSNASLIRNGPNGRTEADLPLKKILANQIPDPPLHDGDILFVPVSGAKNWGEKSMTAILQMAVGVVIYGRL